MPACFTPLQEAAVVPLTGCQSGGLWFWKGHQQDSCRLHGNPKDGNLDLVGGHVFFDSGRFHLLLSHTAPCKDKGFSSSERWSLQEEIKLPDTKRDSLEQRLFLYFSRLLNMWIEVHEQQLTWWLGSLHPYLAMCRLVPAQHWAWPLVLSWHWSQDHHPEGAAARLPLPPAPFTGITRETSSKRCEMYSPASQRHWLCSQLPPCAEQEEQVKTPCASLALGLGKNEKSSPMSFPPYSPATKKECLMSLEQSPVVSLSLQGKEQSGMKEQLWMTEWR